MTKAVTVIPCGHVFNEDTVIQYLVQNKLCPLDAQPIDRYVPNYTIRRLAKLDTSLTPGFRVLFRKQEGTIWILIVRESSGYIKGFALQKGNRCLSPMQVKGIPSTLKLEDLDRTLTILAGSSFRLSDCQIKVLCGLTTKAKLYSKIIFTIGGQETIEFDIHEVVKIAADLLKNLEEKKGNMKIPSQKDRSEFIIFIRKMSNYKSYQSIDNIITYFTHNGEKNLTESFFKNLILPPCISGMQTSQDWLQIAQYIKKFPEGSLQQCHKNAPLGFWIDIGSRLLKIRNTSNHRFYVGDYGFTNDILNSTREIAFSFNWMNDDLLNFIDDFSNKLEEIKRIFNEFADKKDKFTFKIIDNFIEKPIDELRKCYSKATDQQLINLVDKCKFYKMDMQGDSVSSPNEVLDELKKYHPNFSDADLLKIQNCLKPNFTDQKLHYHRKLSLLVYLKTTLWKRYVDLKNLYPLLPAKHAIPTNERGLTGFDHNIIEVANDKTKNIPNSERTGRIIELYNRTVSIIVLASLMHDEIALGQHISLFRPVFSYGDPEEEPPYHEFATSIEEYFRSQKALSSKDLAKKMRELLSRGNIKTDDLSFLPNLVGSWFIAEVSRNPVAMMTGLMILDILEEGVELKDTINGKEENLYSWKNILIHPLNGYSGAKVQALYDTECSVHKWGGAGTMCNKYSVDQTDQTKNPLSNGRPLSPSRQKEGSLILHWLYEYIQRHKVEFEGKRFSVELSTKKLEELPQYRLTELENKINEQNILLQNLEEWRKPFDELKQREKEDLLSPEEKLKLQELKKEGNKLSKQKKQLDKLILKLNQQPKKLKLKKDIIEELLLKRLDTLENLLNVGKSSNNLNRDIIINRLVEEYAGVAVALVLYSKLRGQEEVIKVALEDHLNILPTDIKDELQKLYGQNLYNQLQEIANDIVKHQRMTPFAGDKKDQKTDVSLKTISNSGRGLRCGYYAMGAGILQLPKDERDRFLKVIGFNNQLSEDIGKDQYNVGDQLFRYSIQHSEIFTGAVQLFLSTMVAAFNKQKNIDVAGQYNIDELNQTISQIQEDVGVDIDIYADRIQILGNHIGINCYINGGIYGGGELDNAPRIDIYNPQGGHYECVDRRNN